MGVEPGQAGRDLGPRPCLNRTVTVVNDFIAFARFWKKELPRVTDHVPVLSLLIQAAGVVD